MKNFEAAWLAAMIDGEGTVAVYEKTNGRTETLHKYPIIAVYNTDRRIPNRCKEISGAGYVNENKAEFKVRKRRYFNWRIQNQKDTVRIAKAILPFLISKRRAAKEIIRRWG